MKTMAPHDMQMANEYTYSRKAIDGYIRVEIETSEFMQEKILHGVGLLEDWLSETYFESKQARLNQIKQLDLKELVLSLFVGVAYCQTPELFTSVTAKLASRLRFDDKADSIRTVAEIMAVLCHTDVFDILKPSRSASLMVQSHIPLTDRLLNYIENSEYLPPMVCVPQHLTQNFQNAHLTFNDSLILGKGNHHSGDICLDVINSKNQVPLKLSEEFLLSVDEEPTFEIDTHEKNLNWSRFKQMSNKMYQLMLNQGNEFYLTHKVDKRGRLYAQGYHISTQGSAYKKAMIELANEELVTGVPQ